MAPLGGMRAPIADVASEASATAALEELSREMQNAQAAGRMIVSLPLSEIRLDHLVRDRIPQQGEDMDALLASLRARGQQTPIEVVALAQGGYGLISGWRRCTALSLLQSEGVEMAQCWPSNAVRMTHPMPILQWSRKMKSA